MKYKILFFLSIVSILSCKKDKIDIFQEVYEVEFIGEWNAISHPTNFPTGAHFSPMFGFSHITSLDAIGLGLSATEGIKNMAETGSTAALEDEFLDYQSSNMNQVIK